MEKQLQKRKLVSAPQQANDGSLSILPEPLQVPGKPLCVTFRGSRLPAEKMMDKSTSGLAVRPGGVLMISC